MGGDFPFVITVASEKGGVGKTTIATNLAVYLKALDEDLPVTIASFDNHFSIDSMFAIGSFHGESVAGLFQGLPAAQLARMGEYGVQFLASSPNLTPPDSNPRRLSEALRFSGLSGILILDTRPILDYFTQSALLAADLVLVPVKDRPSLVNAASLARVLKEEDGGLERMWLLPTLIDGRLKLRENLGVREYLAFAAAERGYQVLDLYIAKSPKVESLVTNLSSRVYPVLTHARGTVVHKQLHDLARFALGRYRHTKAPRSQQHVGPLDGAGRRERRVLPFCPLCMDPMNGTVGQFFQDLHSRRRGFLHRACLDELWQQAGFDEDLPERGVVVLTTATTGLDGDDPSLMVHHYDAEANEQVVLTVADFFASGFCELWRQVSGRLPEELYREFLLINLESGVPGRFLAPPADREWGRLRRSVLRRVLERVG